MLRSLKDLERYEITATDGDIGKVADFYLDDERWVVRYLVVKSGGILDAQRQVLISPISFRDIDWAGDRFHLALTKEKVTNSPSVDTDVPVSRQYERDYFRYYGYPYYWGYSGYWGMGAFPDALSSGIWTDEDASDARRVTDPHLRSVNEVRGYHIEGSDGPIGHVHDFIVDDRSWKIQYLVVDTSNWWIGKKVLISPDWATRVNWPDKKVYTDLSKQKIKDSPLWSPEAPVNREYETRLYDFYGRPVYWDDRLPAEAAAAAKSRADRTRAHP